MSSNGTRFAMTLKKSHRFELDSATSPDGCVCSVKTSVRERAVDLAKSLLGKGGTTDFQVRPCGIRRTRKSVVPLNQQPASRSGRSGRPKILPGTLSSCPHFRCNYAVGLLGLRRSQSHSGSHGCALSRNLVGRVVKRVVECSFPLTKAAYRIFGKPLPFSPV